MQLQPVVDLDRSIRALVVIVSIVMILSYLGYAQGTSTFDFCWRDTHGRGAGAPLDLNSCANSSLEKDPNGLLCYPKCNAGYHGVGPVCWQNCPSGFRDDGAFCAKPDAYGRGGGYGWQIGDAAFDSGGQWSRCNHDNPQGCEQPGGGVTLVYPKCKPNFHPVGTNICSPNCSGGMPDIGVSCQKASYGRGAGDVLGCPAGLERSGLLCYSKCGANSDGVGPTCWDQCPSGWVQCGMGCAPSVGACAQATTDQVTTVLSAVAQIGVEVLTAGAASGAMEAKQAALASARTAEKAAQHAAEDAEKVILNMKKAGASVADIQKAELNRAGKVMDLEKAQTAARDAQTDAQRALNGDPKLQEQVKKEVQDKVDKLHLVDAFKNQGTLTKQDAGNIALKFVKPENRMGAVKWAANDVAKAPSVIGDIYDATKTTSLNDAQKQFKIAQSVLDFASTADPTGIMAIVDAYTKPMCSLVGQTVPPPVGSTAAAPKRWTPMIGNVLAIGANAKGVLWAIGNAPGSDHPIYRFNGTNWQQVAGAATRIAVDPAGNGWVVNSAGSIYRFAGAAWQLLPGKAMDIGVGANGSVWIIGADSNIYHLNVAYNSPGPFVWQQVPGGAVRIAVGPDGNPWVVNGGHEIYRYSGNNAWTPLPGAATAIAIDAGGLAYVAGMDGNVYRWAGTNWTQDGVAGENLAGGASGVAYLSKNAAGANAMMIRNP